MFQNNDHHSFKSSVENLICDLRESFHFGFCVSPTIIFDNMKLAKH